MFDPSGLPSSFGKTEAEMERIARQARSAIDKVVEPGKQVSRSEERRKALEKDRYRSGYDQIDWGSNREAAAQEELERWRAIEAVRKSEAYFAILGLPPCPKCKAKVEYVEGPRRSFACVATRGGPSSSCRK